MTYTELLFLALALAVDAFVVAFSYCLVIKKQKFENVLKLMLATGGGQFLMPVIGWYGANLVHGYVEAVDHWIAFFVFAALGVNIIYHAFDNRSEAALQAKVLSFKVLAMIGVATSIDAMVSGLTLYFMRVDVWQAASLIGFVSFVMTIFGFHLARHLKRLPTKYLEIASGVILIALGIKVLCEHLSE